MNPRPRQPAGGPGGGQFSGGSGTGPAASLGSWSDPDDDPERIRELKARYGERAIISLQDIVRHCASASRLVARGRPAYDADEMLRHAGEAILIRAGEGVDRICRAKTDLVDDQPQLELRQLKDARNFVAHGYDDVNYDLLWNILDRDLPRVSDKIAHFISTDD